MSTIIKVGRWLLSRLIARRLYGLLAQGELVAIAWESEGTSLPGFYLRYRIELGPLIIASSPRFLGNNVFKALYRVREALILARDESIEIPPGVPF